MSLKNSIIVPCYNEEKRSSAFIPDLLKYVKKALPNTEVIIVNDEKWTPEQKEKIELLIYRFADFMQKHENLTIKQWLEQNL